MPRHDQPPHDLRSVTPERADEMANVVERVTRLAEERPDVLGLLLVGSYARGTTRPDSDVDLLLLTTNEDGARALYDPTAALSALIDACRT